MGSILLFFVGLQMFNCGEYSPSHPPEYAETKELVSLVKKAAAVVETEGEEAFAEFRKKEGEWFHGETYVFVNDMAGNSVCQPANPEMEGENLDDLKDAMGKPLVRHMINAVSGEGREGWFHYLWPKPGQSEPTWKSSFVIRTTSPAGTEYIVGSGSYNMKMERMFSVDQVDKAVDLIGKQGREAFDILRADSSEFIFMDAYVFVLNDEGIELVNPAFPDFEGQNVLELKDANGKYVSRDMIEALKTKDTAWIDYMWPKPGETESSKKSAFIRKLTIDGETLIVGSGVYLE